MLNDDFFCLTRCVADDAAGAAGSLYRSAEQRQRGAIPPLLRRRPAITAKVLFAPVEARPFACVAPVHR